MKEWLRSQTEDSGATERLVTAGGHPHLRLEGQKKEVALLEYRGWGSSGQSCDHSGSVLQELELEEMHHLLAEVGRDVLFSSPSPFRASHQSLLNPDRSQLTQILGYIAAGSATLSPPSRFREGEGSLAPRV